MVSCPVIDLAALKSATEGRVSTPPSQAKAGPDHSQRHEAPSRILLVDVARALNIQQHKHLHPPVVLPEPGRLPVGSVQLVDNLPIRRLLLAERFPPALRQLPPSLRSLGLALALGRLPLALALGGIVPVCEAVAGDAVSERCERGGVCLDCLMECVE